MSQYAELIAELEKAGDASRALDERIAIVRNPWLADLPRSEHGGWIHPRYGKVAPAAEYTASTDVASAMVPDGYSWEVRRSGFDHYAQANVWDPHRSPPAFDAGNRWRGETRTAIPAIALCIAALKARAAMTATAPVSAGSADGASGREAHIK